MSLLVPESRAYPDSEDLLGEALTALARSAAPSAREVLVSLAVPSDEVRWWREVPEGPAGAASWAEQEQLRGAAHRMLVAGALAVRGPAGHYGARHRRQALASPRRRPRRARTGRRAHRVRARRPPRGGPRGPACTRR